MSSKEQKINSGFARVFGAQPSLLRATPVSVECDITKGLHAFAIVGLPDKAVEEAKDRVASAIKNSGYESPKRSNKKIVVSLAPAELKKEGAAFDLAVALSFLLASEQITFDPEKKMFVGELALDGSIRSIHGALSVAIAAEKSGYTELFVPEENIEEVSLVSGITIFPVSSLEETVAHLSEKKHIRPYARKKLPTFEYDGPTMDDIRGQESAKRGLEIASAGRHNIALYGPPGTGKTMLARAATELLPPLSETEMIQVTAIHSLAGNLSGGVLSRAPFRSPHHTSSYASLIGGGAAARPGEVTLAHCGVLFLDEFPEFHRDVVNALREPLEDKVVSVSRARASHIFPANFMLIAALNPCPCGYYGTKRCDCMPHLVEKYRRKISGPVADRIDMWVSVGDMPPESLTMHAHKATGEAAKSRTRVLRAREIQNKRFAKAKQVMTNADMRPKDIEKLAELSDKAEATLVDAAHRLKLSARGFHRTIKLARTIADLAESSSIEPAHMLEALQYRVREL